VEPEDARTPGVAQPEVAARVFQFPGGDDVLGLLELVGTADIAVAAATLRDEAVVDLDDGVALRRVVHQLEAVHAQPVAVVHPAIGSV